MKDPDHGPMIQAEDFLKTGLKASAPLIKVNTATVTMTNRDTSFAHSFKVTLVKNAKSSIMLGIRKGSDS